MGPIVADDLVQQVRDQLDEQNTTSISDSYILQCLNRGQDFVSNVLARKYPEPLLASPLTVSLVSGQSEYDMPEDIFEDRLQKVEIKEGNKYYPVDRIEYRDLTNQTIDSEVTRPQYYYVRGKTYNLVPTPAGGRNARVWYLKALEPLVKQQGRITNVDVNNGVLTVNTLGSDLTTASTDLNNYINVVDAQTGEVKSSHQIQTIDTTNKQITVKTSPTRTSVYNRTISGTLSSEIEADDYVCVSKGNCIVYLKQPLTNHVIQYAVVEGKRRLGEPTEAEERALDLFERQTEKTWVSRENTARVKKKNGIWNSPLGRNRLRY